VSDETPAGDKSAADETTDGEIILHKTWVYRVIHGIVWTASRIPHRVRIRGVEHIPAGGCMIASNHQSFVDIPLIAGTVPRHVSFVARDSLARSKVLGYIMRQCGAVLVRRGSSDRKALRQMASHMQRGDCVAIFPEGTRSPDGTVQPFKGGALLAARIAKVPIVPMGIRGTRGVLPRGRSLPRPVRVTVEFGPPIDPASPDASQELQQAVEALVGDGRVR